MRQAALETVYELAKNDKRIIFIGSDLGFGTLSKMKQELPNQFLMEGISEQHLVGFASGLAREGYIPYINTIANFFTRRAFEQLAMDSALHKLPVRFLASGGGMVYAPLGPTHTAVDDLGLMWMIPRMRVFSPADSIEMKAILNNSITDLEFPWYIRFGKGDEPDIFERDEIHGDEPKKFLNANSSILILTTGILLHTSLSALSVLESSIREKVSIIHFPRIDNIRLAEFKDEYLKSKSIVVIEEHFSRGGLFSRILHLVNSTLLQGIKITHMCLPDDYSQNYGSQQDHLKAANLDAKGIANMLRRLCV